MTPSSNALILACKSPLIWGGAVLKLSITPLDQKRDESLNPRPGRELLQSNGRILKNPSPCDVALKVDEKSRLISHILISYLNGTVEKIECSYSEH